MADVTPRTFAARVFWHDAACGRNLNDNDNDNNNYLF